MGLSSAITADTAHTHADSHILSSNMASPHANTSLRPTPGGADEEALVMLSDVLLTGSNPMYQTAGCSPEATSRSSARRYMIWIKRRSCECS